MVREIYRKETDNKGRKMDVLVRREIWLGEKELKLKFTMPVWFRMEDEICTLDDLYTMMHERDRLKEGKIPLLVSIMSGGDVTPKEVLRESDPATMKAIMQEIMRVSAEAVTMKEKRYEDDSVHDEVLEEIEKKETKAD